MGLIDEEAKVDDIQDIDLSQIRKKKFRIDGDNSRILELNVSDLGIISRLKETYPKLKELSEQASTAWPDTEIDTTAEDYDFMEDENVDKTMNVLKDIDNQMREGLDYIFDSNVSEVCAPDGSMYDPFNGKFRFEHILEVLSKLYETNMEKEVAKITSRVDKHTSKYTKKKKK